jgi:hypothetical protein
LEQAATISEGNAMFLSEHRKKFWVNPQIQGGLLARAGFCWLVYHLVLWHGIFLIRYIGHRMEVLTGGAADRSIASVYGDFASDYAVLGFFAFLLAPLLAYDLLRQSHRVAGPLVRFESALKDLMNGRSVKPVELRPRDQLASFQKVFNEFLAFYSNQQQERSNHILEDLSHADAAAIAKLLDPNSRKDTSPIGSSSVERPLMATVEPVPSDLPQSVSC